MDKVRVAVVGLGAWGACHVEAFASLPQAEVVAVCDVDAARLNEIADRFGVAVRHATPEPLWERDDIDLVSIVTSEANRLGLVQNALQSGKHVLVEKPVALNVEEARAMREAAQASGRLLVPGHILRFEPRYAEAKRVLDAGQIGRVASIFSKRARPHWQFAIYGRVHPVWIVMAHDIDLALWYSGSRVRSVRAWQRQINPGQNPDLLWACLEFENGVLAVLQSAWLVPDSIQIGRTDTAEIMGSTGVISLDAGESGFEIWDKEGRHSPDYTIHGVLAGRTSGALREELRYLCDCIRTGEEPAHVSFDDAVHNVEIATAIIRSAQTGQDVIL